MTLPHSPIPWRGRTGREGPDGNTAPQPPARDGTSLDVTRLVRALERTKRSAGRLPPAAGRDGPFPGYFSRSTYASFRLDGLQTTEAEVAQALARGSAARACRSRLAQRVRNHVAVLRHVERLLRRGEPLQARHVIRWYTSIASGLSSGGIDDHSASRVSQIVTTMNSPQMRLWPAVQEVASLHVRLLADPFVPGFNGIMARVLLRYHLGRCGLPPVVFNPESDGPLLASEATLLPRLLEVLSESYDRCVKT